ncbi:MAG: hypothetical protein A3G34_01945 [Candidatus Lindowbacteria bacterium RIFCSPLOWO2_12_FULL_62_27]|nr:MAG: hypothetical protein A3I06_11465 [Candidatus Lindowbacteria bacterium RIFCSPLOWO2_02_FULL_62_12]OGH59071.1 MAG: hypothetical protein A3G34_01945 [Candidatus Lindowbacteria bacterium RIFCSPLOWO2_12_FULL_62_27]
MKIEQIRVESRVKRRRVSPVKAVLGFDIEDEAVGLVKRSAFQETALTRDELRKIAETFFGNLQPNTQRGYANALRQFCAFVGVRTISELLGLLYRVGAGKAHVMLLDFRNHLLKSGRSSGTINGHISAIRQFSTFACMAGILNWKFSLRRLPYLSLRDTRGPGLEGVQKMINEAARQPGPRGLRDVALLRVLWDLGFRRGEVVRLDVSDVDFEGEFIWVLGKMRLQKEKIGLPPETIQALRAWLGDRRSGPLFTNVARGAFSGNRMSDDMIYAVIRGLGAKCGMRVRPHGIRHAAITHVLDVTKDPRLAQRFARHTNMDTILRYDDNRKDMAGAAAKTIAGYLVTPSVSPSPSVHESF